MIIKIEDAPAVSHITIDIDFTEDGAQTTILQDGIQKKSTPSIMPDTALNLDEDFTQEVQEVVDKPQIDVADRAPKVSQEMNDLEL